MKAAKNEEKEKKGPIQRFFRRADMDKEFSGYVWETTYDEKGKRHKTAIYKGDYYYYNYRGEELKKIKRRTLAVNIVTVCIYLACAGLVRTAGQWSTVVTALELLPLIPMIYLIMGTVVMLTTKEPFEEKVPLTGVRRLKNSGMGFCVLAAAAGIADIVYLIIKKPQQFAGDIFLILGIIACIVLQLAMRRLYLTFKLEKASQTNSTEEENHGT